MANGTFNIARGKVGWYANASLGLAGANSRLVIVALEAAEADNTLNNYNNLSLLLAEAGNTEATATGYARKSHAAAGVVWSEDDTGNTAKVVISSDDVWTAVSGTAFVKLLVCYDADNTAGTDADIIPLTYHDFAVTPNGGDITADYNATTGVWSSS